MSSEEVVEVIRRLVLQVSELSIEVNPETAFVKDLGLESIQIIEFLCEVEDYFDIVISESELSDVVTLADLAEVVKKNTK